MKKLLLITVFCFLFTACSGKTPPANSEIPLEPGIDIEIPVDSNNPDDTDNPIEVDLPGEDQDTEPQTEPIPEAVNPSPLTGLEMEGKYQPVAILVENFAAARPHSGVIDADIVYEAHVEGGITRLLAIYYSKTPAIVGPVRSLRHYYLWMAQEWDAYLVHFGQSFIAAEHFSKVNVKRLNGLYTDKPFWRDNTRKAPHNVYIDAVLCRDRINYDQKAEGMLFSLNKAQEGTPYNKITIPYNRTVSLVSYLYDEDRGLNLRSINGKPDVDKETGEQVYARNVIIQYAKHSILEPGAGYRHVEMFGTGKAQYFINGQWIEGAWERRNADSKTVYLNSNNEEIYFSPGNTWIQVVQEDMKVVVE